MLTCCQLDHINRNIFQVAGCLSSHYGIADREFLVPSAAVQRSAQLQCSAKLIVEIDMDDSAELMGSTIPLKPVSEKQRNFIAMNCGEDTLMQVHITCNDRWNYSPVITLLQVNTHNQ